MYKWKLTVNAFFLFRSWIWITNWEKLMEEKKFSFRENFVHLLVYRESSKISERIGKKCQDAKYGN